MARTKDKALFTVKVWFQGQENPFNAHFISEKEAYDYLTVVRKRPEVMKTDMSYGIKIYKTAEEALESFMMWMR